MSTYSIHAEPELIGGEQTTTDGDAVQVSIDALRALLRAAHAVTEELPIVLRAVVDVARYLVDAPYGALIVLGPEGHRLEQFVHAGLDGEAAGQIEHVPEGKGLLGAFLEDPRPIRLDDLGTDPRSIGFPAHHPLMRAFLGVPIRDHGAVLGGIYVTRPEDRPFTTHDQDVVQALAASAASVIAHARPYAQATQWQECLQASTDFMQDLLTHRGIANPQLLAEQARVLADADVVMVASFGDGEPDPVTVTTRTEDVVASANAADDPPDDPPDDPDPRPRMTTGHMSVDGEDGESGPTMTLPIAGASAPHRVLTVARRPGRSTFSNAAVDSMRSFVGQVGLALELAESHPAQQLLEAMNQQRDAIARDLHEHVIQQLFISGLTLQGALQRPPDQTAVRITEVIDRLDDTIRHIRTNIAALQNTNLSDGPTYTHTPSANRP